MRKVIIFNKEVGETPLECLERARIEEKIAKDVPMTYAGRLDPMAEGVLLILAGEECKNKEKYLGFDKEYEVEVLFGIETDTYDALGKVGIVKTDYLATFNEKFVKISSYVKKWEQEYPTYSSKIIAMKELPEEIPTKEVEIYSIEKLDEREVSGKEIAEKSIEKIQKVKGNFRQKEIMEGWQKFGQDYLDKQFKIIKLKVKCSSGTYMRSLAHNLGKEAETGAIAYSIVRTRIFQS